MYRDKKDLDFLFSIYPHGMLYAETIDCLFFGKILELVYRMEAKHTEYINK